MATSIPINLFVEKEIVTPKPKQEAYIRYEDDFENLYFFWYSNGPKKTANLFFVSKSKVQKSKNMHSYYFSLNLKFY